jgi:hypothetical protein
MRFFSAGAVLVLALGGCARTRPVVQADSLPAEAARPAPRRETPPAAGARLLVRPRAACADALPPSELLTDNLMSTSLSALGEIVAASKTGPGGKGSAPTAGYVTFRYEVEVIRPLYGAPPPERLVLLQRAEADFEPEPVGTLLLFSACASSAGTVYEPDVGYVFPVVPACRAEAEEHGIAAAKRVRGAALAARSVEAACKR